MDRNDLVKAAEREGIRSSAYSLDGGLPAEQYVLALEEGGGPFTTRNEDGERARSVSTPSMKRVTTS